MLDIKGEVPTDALKLVSNPGSAAVETWFTMYTRTFFSNFPFASKNTLYKGSFGLQE